MFHPKLFNNRFIYVFITGLCLSYIVSMVGAGLAIDFPQVRFYGKYIAALAFLLIAIDYLLRSFKVPMVPAIASAFIFYIYIVAHNIIFGSNFVPSYGEGVIFLYLMAICFWLIPKSDREYLLLIKILWFCFGFTLLYYLLNLYVFLEGNFLQNIAGMNQFVFSSGSFRIYSEDTGSLINSNTYSFMAVMFSILSVRIYECVNKNRNRDYKLTIFVAISLVFSMGVIFLHMSLMATLLMFLIILILIFKSSVTKWQLLFCSALLIGFFLIFFEFDLLRLQFDLFAARIEGGAGSGQAYRVRQILFVLERFYENPLFGSSLDYAVNDGSGTTQHTHYLNILAIYGIVGFILFSTFVFNILKCGWNSATPAQIMARVLFLGIWATSPTIPLQIAALVVMIPDKYFLKKSIKLKYELR